MPHTAKKDTQPGLGLPCVAFTGGGTGGHVYPGLAVIEELRRRWNCRVVWIGSGKEIERKAVEADGIEFIAIPSGKFRRELSIKNLTDILRIISGYFAAKRVLRKLKPLFLFSKGGYVSVPPCRAAASLGIPVYTHESDVSPGLATKLNLKCAKTVFLSWETTLGYLGGEARAKALVTGQPVRQAISRGNPDRGRAWLGLRSDLPLVLVLGGSQGAAQINELIKAALPAFAGKVAVAHQYGSGHEAARNADGEYHGFDFAHGEMADLYAAADLIVGRAGAGTVWESIAAGKPAIYVPLSGVGTRGDQVENARTLEQAGAAICLEGKEAQPERLVQEVLSLAAKPELRARMVEAGKKLGGADAAATIAGMLVRNHGAHV